MTATIHHASRLVAMYAPHGNGFRKYGLPTMRREGISAALRLAQKSPSVLRGSLGIHLHRAMQQPLECGRQVAA